MAINQLTKHTDESFAIYGGITNVAVDGESIVGGSSSVECTDVNGDDASAMKQGSPTVSTNGLRLYQRIKKGEGTEVLSPYKFVFEMYTSEGNTFVKHVFLYIKDRI